MSGTRSSPWSDKPKGKACEPLLRLLRQIDPMTQCERKFDWLFIPKTYERSQLEQNVFLALQDHCRKSRNRHPVKKTCDPDRLLADETIKSRSRALEFDFFLPSLNTAVEFDERQHFTEERKISLQCYEQLRLDFDRERWIELCSSNIQDSDPPCRDWIRAFRDAVRDIRADRHGFSLVRIYYKDFQGAECASTGAIERLRKMISPVK